jgi:hypothetical protein
MGSVKIMVEFNVDTERLGAFFDLVKKYMLVPKYKKYAAALPETRLLVRRFRWLYLW